MDESKELEAPEASASADRGDTWIREWYSTENMPPHIAAMLEDILAYGNRYIKDVIAVGQIPTVHTGIVLACYQLGFDMAKELYEVNDAD